MSNIDRIFNNTIIDYNSEEYIYKYENKDEKLKQKGGNKKPITEPFGGMPPLYVCNMEDLDKLNDERDKRMNKIVSFKKNKKFISIKNLLNKNEKKEEFLKI